MYSFSEFGQNTIKNLPNTNYYEVLSGNTYLRFGTVYRHPKTFREMEIGEVFTGGCEVYRRVTDSAFDIVTGFIDKDAAHWSANNQLVLWTVSWALMQQNALPLNTAFLFEWQVQKESDTSVRLEYFFEGSRIDGMSHTMSEDLQDLVFNIQHNSNTDGPVANINTGIRCRNFYHTDTEHRLRNWEFKRMPLISLNEAATSKQLNEQMLGIPVGTVLEMKPDTSEIQDGDIVGVLTAQQARLRRVSMLTKIGAPHRTFGHKTMPVQELNTLTIDSSSDLFYRVEESIGAETEQGMSAKEVDQIHLRTEFKFK